ncbi:hypothetical protein AAF712_001698 [Marasmius tenuissimus]|uniref:MYND-type domain-containing protein n=1 Tax=Marasmius tenuissimus TaxID=585030 RepID=A0ABR3ADU9_9AGAR
MSTLSRFDTCCICNRTASEATGQLQRCSRCKAAYYCGQACQKRSWKSHKKICKDSPDLRFSEPSEGIPGVRLLGGFNSPFWPEAKVISPNHPVWTKGSVSPVSQIVGVPLLIYRELEELELESPNDPNRDNQAATFLMIDPQTGFASPRWQKNVGPVTVARGDHKPLSKIALEMIWMYCDRILDVFGDDGSTPWNMYTKEFFDEFCQDYKENALMNGRRVADFNAQEVPL